MLEVRVGHIGSWAYELLPIGALVLLLVCDSEVPGIRPSIAKHSSSSHGEMMVEGWRLVW